MVIPNWLGKKDENPTELSFQNEKLRALSRPVDRLAAAIIDIFVVLMPIYLLLIATVRMRLTTSVLLGSLIGIFVYFILHVLIGLVLVVVYQSYMHWKFGATVGKFILNLRVRTIWSNTNPEYATAVKRSLVWLVEMLFVGVPFLAIFTNSQRRILHDRICDTEVISLKEMGVLPPRRAERVAAYTFAVFGLFMTVALYGGMLVSLGSSGSDSELAALLATEDGRCQEVSLALDATADDKGQKDPNRMQTAMSLYAAGIVEKSCLAGETERELDVEFNGSPLAYLAKAFVHSEDADVSDAYLEQVCKEGPGTPECSMSELVTRWSEEDWPGVEAVISHAPIGSVYLEIWAIRHFMKQGEYAKALAYVERISPNRLVGSFLQSQRVKALWKTGQEKEAVVAAAQAMETLTSSEQLHLASWVCFEQLTTSCSASPSAACSWVKKQTAEGRLDLSEAKIGLAELRVQECQNAEAVDYASFADNSDDESWKVFLSASSKEAKSDRESASTLFMEVVKGSEAAEDLRLEAMRRFLRVSKTADVLAMITVWREMDRGELWRESGHLLLSSLAQKNEKLAALKVGRDLMRRNVLSDDGMKVLASLLKASSADSRLPASVGVGEKVKKLLEASDDESEGKAPPAEASPKSDKAAPMSSERE